MNGIEAAESASLTPIKINSVVVRDYNEEDVVALAKLTIEKNWHVRFIELMPLGGGECARLSLSQFVPNRETRNRMATIQPTTRTATAPNTRRPQTDTNTPTDSITYLLPSRSVVDSTRACSISISRCRHYGSAPHVESRVEPYRTRTGTPKSWRRYRQAPRAVSQT